MHIFDNAYNLAIAEQHMCKYYDLYDAYAELNNDYNNVSANRVDIDSNKIPLPLLENLAGMSWTDFGQLIYDDKIVEHRKKWLAAFDNQDINETKKQFSLYIDCLMQKIPKLSTKIINNSIFYRMSGTKRFVNVTVSETGRMVGGGSSDEQLSSDEVCLYFGGNLDEKTQDKVVRYASTDDVSVLFETVIAPMEQAINRHNKVIIIMGDIS